MSMGQGSIQIPAEAARPGSPPLVWGLVIVLGAVVVSVQFGTIFGTLACVIAALHALRGARQTVEALGLLAFILLLGAPGASAARWVVLAAAFGRTIWDSITLSGGTPRFIRPLALFGLVILVITPLSSAYPLVSIFKVISFVIGVGTLFTAMHRTAHLRDYWFAWYFTFAVFILLASVPLYFTGGGYTRNASGFQGILSHPQTFGPVLAPITVLMSALYLFHDRKTPLVLSCILMGFVGMYMSQSRTSIFAVMLALGVAAALAYTVRSEWNAALSRAIGRAEMAFVIVIVCGFVVLQWSTIQDTMLGFLFKDDQVESVSGILEGSRGNLMDRSMANFRAEPVTGIGFGVPSEVGSFERRMQTGALGLPTGASVEKGFMPTAVLEETGIVGAVLVVLLLLSLFGPLVRQGSFMFFWMTATCLLVNFGEMVFFSLGGMGLYFWFVMALCYMIATTTPQVIEYRTVGAGAQ